LLGRDRDLVETLLQERSAEIMRTRVALRHQALDASTAQAVEEPPPAPQERSTVPICMDCGGAIQAARLRAIPTAIRCTGCQLLYESQAL
jgi:RNA polymerase-binding transcription factor DksA